MMRDWNWTPRAYSIWADIKFIFYGLIVLGLCVLADWIARTWLT